ncbi:MAG: hypothetical protein GY754_06560 [bacterium]|nr:hypothetical protein [bacterium]
MNRTILFVLLAVVIAMPGYTQPADEAAEKKEDDAPEKAMVIGDRLYSEETLEDFEKTEFSKKDLVFRAVKDRQQGSIKIRNMLAAPTGSSKKYLGVKVFGKKGDSFTIVPAKTLEIKKRCQSIGIWVYGKRFSGGLSMYIRDVDNKNHRIRIGALNYLGWKKFIVKIPRKVRQEDKFLSQKKSIKITKIVYRPGNSKRKHPKWQYFYIDDITVMVREKYTDRQSDDW